MKIIIKFIKGKGRKTFVKLYVIVSLFPNMILKYTDKITIIKHIVKLKCFIRVGYGVTQNTSHKHVNSQVDGCLLRVL